MKKLSLMMGLSLFLMSCAMGGHATSNGGYAVQGASISCINDNCVSSGGSSSSGPMIQPSGTITSQERTVAVFNCLEYHLVGTVHLVNNGPVVKIETDVAFLPHIKTEVVNNCLQVSATKSLQLGTTKFNVFINAKNVTSILNMGSATIVADYDIKQENLDVTLGGSGRINLGNVDISNKLVLTLSGSGAINASGKTQVLEANLPGAGKITTPASDFATVMLSGAGEISVGRVSNKINGSLSGAGTINGSGPAHREIDKSGAGQISWH